MYEAKKNNNLPNAVKKLFLNQLKFLESFKNLKIQDTRISAKEKSNC